MESDKSKLKKSKKSAELAKEAVNPVKVGQRFFNVFEWGERLVEALLSVEQRLRQIEYILDGTTLTKNRYLISNAIVKITSEQTINSDTVVKVTTTNTINSDAFIGQETEKAITSNAFVGQEATKTITSDSEVSE